MSSSRESSTDSEDYLANCPLNDPGVGVTPGCGVKVGHMRDKGCNVTVLPEGPLPEPPLMPEAIKDTRFDVNPQEMFFVCDRCGKRVQPRCVNMPVDGDYQARKLAINNHTFRGRWEAGENFLWFCISCLAITEGKQVEVVWAERGSSLKPHPYRM